MTALPPVPERRLGLVIDLDTCVGCHACAVSCKEWNTGGLVSPLPDEDPWGTAPRGVWLNRVHTFEVAAPAPGGEGSEAQTPPAGGGGGERLHAGPAPGVTGAGGEAGQGRGRTVHFPRSCLHCDDAPCVTVCPTGASWKRAEDGIVLVDERLCIGCKLCSWACPYGAREFDAVTGVMKKCTLCIDRIYNPNIPRERRVPACVAACPAGARHFGDLADPDSAVSRLVADRGGVDLMPETGCRPVNKYLPPRWTREEPDAPPSRREALPDAPPEGGFLGWIDRLLS